MGPLGLFAGPIELAAGATSTVTLPLNNIGSMGAYPGTIELAAGASSTVPPRTQSTKYQVSAVEEARRFNSESALLDKLGSNPNCDFLFELEDQQRRMRNEQLQSQMNPDILDQPVSSTLVPTLKRCVSYSKPEINSSFYLKNSGKILMKDWTSQRPLKPVSQTVNL